MNCKRYFFNNSSSLDFSILYLIQRWIVPEAILHTSNDTSKSHYCSNDDFGDLVIVKLRNVLEDTQEDVLHGGEDGDDADKSHYTKRLGHVDHQADHLWKRSNPHSKNV